MKKLLTALCAAVLIGLIPIAAYLREELPVDVQPLIEEKYGGWAGVLRLWVFEGWTPGAGSVSGWLNGCIASFERGHDGVYIQPEYVSASAIADLGRDGVLPPDMLLFPPSLLESPEGLAPLGDIDAARGPLKSSGRGYAAPVLMGGYLWVYDADSLPGLPGSWREAEIMPLVPEDEPFRQWSAALLGLCSGRSAPGRAAEPSTELDLGLSMEAPATAAPSPAPEADATACQLPEGFVFAQDAWRAFANGEAAAMLATAREVRRLEALSAQGKGPDWRLAACSPGTFTDQLLYLSIVDRGADDPRAALCREFIEHILGDACQRALCKAGAFSVTDAPSGYGSGDPLAIMDAALRRDDLAPAPAFGTQWKRTGAENIRKFIDESADATSLWREFTAILS